MDLLPKNAVLTCEQMAQSDRYTIESGLFTGIELMENAGEAVVDVILRDFAEAKHVHVLCGPGNNGGDGYVVARLLAERGLGVSVYGYGTSKPGTDAELAAAKWQGEVNPLAAFEPDHGDLVVDALFGAGFSGDLPNEICDTLLRAMNDGVSIVAVDLPSGIDGDTGLSRFAARVQATITFHRLKPAHCLQPSRHYCGAVHVADIGVESDPDLFAGVAHAHNIPEAWDYLLPELLTHHHKYTRGHVAVFSGPRHATGASRLSAMAAQRAGAGAVTLLGKSSAIDVHTHHVTSVMLKTYERGEALGAFDALNTVRSAVLGPGFGDFEQAREIALGVLARRHEFERLLTLVLDADGITAFQDDPAPLFEAAQFEHALGLVLTPHEGEFARLFPDIAENPVLGKPQKALAAAQRANAVIVYKGSDTVIAAPAGDSFVQERLVYNTHTTPKLATAGSGDVLAGIIAALCAQHMPPFEAACAAVWLHADAAMRAGPLPIAEDLIEQISPALAELS